MAVSLSLFAGAGWQFFDNNGKILSGGNLYIYSAGTTTPLTTYTSSAGTIANSNPIVLDSAGRVPNEIWINTTSTAKFVLYTSTGSLIGTWDNIPSYAAALNLTGTNNAVAYFNSVGTFTSSSNMTFDGSNLTVAGGITAGSNVSITGSISTTGTATFGGNTAVTGTISATGGITSSTTAVTQSVGDNSTKIATTAFVASTSAKAKIQPLTVSGPTGGVITLTLAPTTLDFRDTNTGSGTITSVSNSSSLTIQLVGAATLGAVSGVQTRIAVLAIYNSTIAAMELAVVNVIGGAQIDECNIVNTSAVSSGTSASVFYSTTARSSVAYRVVGFIDATNTSGSWTALSLIQGGAQYPTGPLNLRIAKAWVNWDGSLTTPITPRTNYNVGSITKNGTGDYTLNFTTAMSDANYSISGMTNGVTSKNASYLIIQDPSNAPTTTACRILTYFGQSTTTFLLTDYTRNMIQIFGN